MNAKHTVQKWIDAFNRGDFQSLEDLYAEDAVNHQMPNVPIKGKAAIGEMLRQEFSNSPEMFCIPVQILEDGEWAALEWRDPKDFRGCGFFHVQQGKITEQRGYWDRLSFEAIYKNKQG
jgi:ketosteroid isomerase-like protein